jgi:hypothetical protein
MREFDTYIKTRFGDSSTPPPEEIDSIPIHDYYEDDEDDGLQMPEADDIGDLDRYINAEVLLPQDGEYMRAARVTGRVRGPDGHVKGRYDPNPILNSQVYDVMFPDGATQQYAANIIAENMLSQVDEEGYHYQLLDHIIDHRTNGHAVSRADGYTTTKSGRRAKRQTT